MRQQYYPHQNLDRGLVRMGTGTVVAFLDRLLFGPEAHSIHRRQPVSLESNQTGYETCREVIKCHRVCKCSVSAVHQPPQTEDHPIR